MSMKIACGECFEWAFDNLRADNKMIMVHAIVHHPWDGKPFPHAWLESKTRVRDWQSAVQGLGPGKKGWNKENFYELFKPIKIHRYNFDDARVEAIKSGHYGPWD